MHIYLFIYVFLFSYASVDDAAAVDGAAANPICSRLACSTTSASAQNGIILLVSIPHFLN